MAALPVKKSFLENCASRTPGCFMELCWKGDRVSEFSPKSGTDYFSLLYKTDVCKIKAVELNLSVAIKAGFVASLSGQAFSVCATL
jgi:hypothetical protein